MLGQFGRPDVVAGQDVAATLRCACAVARGGVRAGSPPFLSTTMSSRPSPLPLEDTLRDLALLRACDIDLASLVPNTQSQRSAGDGASAEVEASVDRSYDFVKQARAALKILNREDVERQGNKVEEVRITLEDALDGLRR